MEIINLVAAGLLAAAGAHMGLSLLSMPGLLASTTTDVFGIVLTYLKITWSAVGFMGGAYVLYNAVSMVNARCFNKARVASVGALVLPFLGLQGIVTAFALLPLGAIAVVLLRRAEWKAAFGAESEFAGSLEA